MTYKSVTNVYLYLCHKILWAFHRSVNNFSNVFWEAQKSTLASFGKLKKIERILTTVHCGKWVIPKNNLTYIGRKFRIIPIIGLNGVDEWFVLVSDV